VGGARYQKPQCGGFSATFLRARGSSLLLGAVTRGHLARPMPQGALALGDLDLRAKDQGRSVVGTLGRPASASRFRGTSGVLQRCGQVRGGCA
jgi:hypothetical protein